MQVLIHIEQKLRNWLFPANGLRTWFCTVHWLNHYAVGSPLRLTDPFELASNPAMNSKKLCAKVDLYNFLFFFKDLKKRNSLWHQIRKRFSPSKAQKTGVFATLRAGVSAIIRHTGMQLLVACTGICRSDFQPLYDPLWFCYSSICHPSKFIPFTLTLIIT